MAKTKKKHTRIFDRKPSKRFYDPDTEYPYRLKSGKWVIHKYWFVERKPTAYNAFQKEFAKVLKEKGVDVKKTKSGSYQKLLSEVWKSEKKKNKLDIKGQSKKAVAKKEKATKKFLEKIDASKIFEQIEKQIERLTIKGRTPSEAEKIETLKDIEQSENPLDRIREYFGDLAYEGQKDKYDLIPESFWWNLPDLMQNIIVSDIHNKKRTFVLFGKETGEDGIQYDDIREVDTTNGLEYADELRMKGDEVYDNSAHTEYPYMVLEEFDEYVIITLSSFYADWNRNAFENEHGFRKVRTQTENDADFLNRIKTKPVESWTIDELRRYAKINLK